jgi:hypothetical protein
MNGGSGLCPYLSPHSCLNAWALGFFHFSTTTDEAQVAEVLSELAE